MSHVTRALLAAGLLFATVAAGILRQPASQPTPTTGKVDPAMRDGFDVVINQNAQRMIAEGRTIFRFDTFGDEAFWGDQLKLHQAIVGEKLGGVGPGVSPKMALSVGLKVDADALPADLVAQIKAGQLGRPCVDRGAPQGERGRRRHRVPQSGRVGEVGRDPVRAVPLDRG